jgi:hypothetical protein
MPSFVRPLAEPLATNHALSHLLSNTVARVLSYPSCDRETTLVLSTQTGGDPGTLGGGASRGPASRPRSVPRTGTMDLPSGKWSGSTAHHLSHAATISSTSASS